MTTRPNIQPKEKPLTEKEKEVLAMLAELAVREWLTKQGIEKNLNLVA